MIVTDLGNYRKIILISVCSERKKNPLKKKIKNLELAFQISWNAKLKTFGILEREKKKMEKICEFCTALKPVIYCKADAAHLCLSCDAKVHSANALSSRHFRSILCDSCRLRPANVQCLDHQMFICGGCDTSLHDASSRHQQRPIKSFVGCPSAKDFAALWGLKLSELESVATNTNNSNNQFLASSSDSNVVNLDTPQSEVGVSNQQVIFVTIQLVNVVTLFEIL